MTKLSRYCALIGIVALTLSCAPSHPNTLRLSQAFSADEIAIIVDAIETWELQAGPSAHIDVSLGYEGSFSVDTWDDWGPPTMYRIHSESAAYAVLSDRVGTDIAGAASSTGDIAIVQDKMTSEAVHRFMVLHEIGHFFGLCDGPGIMARVIPNAPLSEIDEASLVAFHQASGSQARQHFLTCGSRDP